jgi:hypothetical protein
MEEQKCAVERWPLDIEKLQRGDFISPEVCAQLTQVPIASREYPLALLKLSRHIQDEGDRTGRCLPCRCHMDGIEVMTSEVATVYYNRRWEMSERGMATAHRNQLTRVNPRELSDADAATHQRQLALHAMQLNASRKVKVSYAKDLETKDVRSITGGAPQPADDLTAEL